MADYHHDSPLLFFHADFPKDDKLRQQIRKVVEDLPEESIVGQWAVGITDDYPAKAKKDDKFSPAVDCTKPCHQQPNQHVSFRLKWVNANGDNQLYATVHLHENGMESVRVKGLATQSVKRPGMTTWDVHPLMVPVSPTPASSSVAPWAGGGNTGRYSIQGDLDAPSRRSPTPALEY